MGKPTADLNVFEKSASSEKSIARSTAGELAL